VGAFFYNISISIFLFFENYYQCVIKDHFHKCEFSYFKIVKTRSAFAIMQWLSFLLYFNYYFSRKRRSL